MDGGQTFSSTIQLAIAIATELAAAAAWLSAHATNRAAESQLFSQLMHEYADPSMAHSLRVLREWGDHYGERLAEEFVKQFREGKEDALRADEARRQVWYYFMTVFRLHEAGLVDKKFVRRVAARSGIERFQQEAEPMGRQTFSSLLKTRPHRMVS
jgi:hypothetical protein